MTHTILYHELYPAIDRAVAEVMNQQAPDCPPLYWTPLSGRVSEGARGLAGAKYCPDGAVAAVKTWVERFGLHPDEAPMPGTISYHGEINGLPVIVWAIIDHHDAFGHRVTPAKPAVRHTAGEEPVL
jgi:hypothetical protein